MFYIGVYRIMTYYHHTPSYYFQFSIGLFFCIVASCQWLLVFYLMPHFFLDYPIPIPTFVSDMHQWLHDHYLVEKWNRHGILFIMFFVFALLCSGISYHFSKKLEA